MVAEGGKSGHESLVEVDGQAAGLQGRQARMAGCRRLMERVGSPRNQSLSEQVHSVGADGKRGRR